MSATPTRVLLVEGSARNMHLLRLALRDLGLGYELNWAGGLSAALRLLAGGSFSVVLLDPNLPDAQADEAVRQLRAACPDVPLLLLASAADVGLCLRAMEEGAHDYLFKDVLTTHFLARMIRDAVERPASAASGDGRLMDPLTGLANHEGLLSQAAQLWRSPVRLRKGATLLSLALDRHAVNSGGDRALVEIAGVLRDTFRGSDLRARVGDAEFAVLAVGAPSETAPILTARLDEMLQCCNAQPDRGYQLSLTVGLSHYDPEQPCSFEEMLRTAQACRGRETLGRGDVPAAVGVPAPA
jgi:diguanylate cyclase (GGDEF)-like protein